MRKRALLTGLTGFGRIYRIGGGRLARGEGVINTLFGVGRVGEGEMEGWRDGGMEDVDVEGRWGLTGGWFFGGVGGLDLHCFFMLFLGGVIVTGGGGIRLLVRGIIGGGLVTEDDINCILEEGPSRIEECRRNCRN
jgi:hypothetical protein